MDTRKSGGAITGLYNKNRGTSLKNRGSVTGIQKNKVGPATTGKLGFYPTMGNRRLESKLPTGVTQENVDVAQALVEQQGMSPQEALNTAVSARNPTRPVVAPKVASRILTAPLGRIPGKVPGTLVSARLNPDIATNPEKASVGLGLVLASEPPSNSDLANVINELGTALGLPSTGGKRRYRGGEPFEGLEGLLDEDKVAFAKAVTLMVAYNAGQMSKEVALAAAGPSLEYLKSRIADPLKPIVKRVKDITLSLADQLFQVPITGVKLSFASLGFTMNFVSKVVEKLNGWGGKSADYLLSDDTAKKAADVATASIKDVGKTGAVAAFVLNQIGVLPLSAVLAGILFTIQVNLGSGAGRAYLVTGFYAWYNSQPDAKRKEIDKAASEYATSAAKSAKEKAAGAAPKVKDAAASLGRLLAQKVNGKSVVQSMASAAPAAAATEAAALAQLDASAAAIPAALENGAPAAALAASAAEEVAASPAVVENVRSRRRLNAAAPSFPAAAASAAAMQTGEGRRKTRKGKSKRRVTRRRKATKYLTAPVFAY
jgi:hypothetical protein